MQSLHRLTSDSIHLLEDVWLQYGQFESASYLLPHYVYAIASNAITLLYSFNARRGNLCAIAHQFLERCLRRTTSTLYQPHLHFLVEVGELIKERGFCIKCISGYCISRGDRSPFLICLWRLVLELSHKAG